MSANRLLRRLLWAALATSLATPASAQTVGGDLGGFIQNLIDLLNSGVVRGLAVLAVIITGIVWMFGQIDLRRSRLNLFLSPRVCAATEASDFDLRTLRQTRASIYLATSPENLSRVAPLHGLLLQQLTDALCRARPDPRREPHQVLLLLDEFARLGHATVLAKAFAYVAGYGVRLLPVLQSPAQLRAEYGADLAEDILSNCAVEVAYAPKDLRLANELSERLGYSTVRTPSRSRPTGLSRGHRSLTESDQRRALLLPQELAQMPAERLLVLKAGIPPVRGRKIVFHRERVFRARIRPAPRVQALPTAVPASTEPPGRARLTLDAIVPLLAAGGLEPLPPAGTNAAEIGAWVDRFLDATEPRHAR